jgi:T5orf172 domain
MIQTLGQIEPREVQQTYFIGRADHKGPVKIGKSANPVKRLASLQTGNPHALKIWVLLPTDVEASLHSKYARQRRHTAQGGYGGEWFDIPYATVMQEPGLTYQPVANGKWPRPYVVRDEPIDTSEYVFTSLVGGPDIFGGCGSLAALVSHSRATGR